MKFFISAVIGALFPFCPAAYAGLDIKGVRVDVAPDCVHITSIETRIGTFGDVCTPRRPRIYRKVSFLDQPADMEIYFGAEGLVKAVSVLGFDFDRGFSSLSTKFGKATVEESVIRNAFGAKFQQQVITWRQGAVSLVLSKHGPSIGSPSLFLSGEIWVTEEKGRLKPSSDL